MHIDHHLQQAILRQLAASDTFVRYSDLKQGDIENSLFSYHLNKLLDRAMVEKKGDGYVLSTDGARWLNDNGFGLKRPETPRVFVALVVRNASGNYLVGQRTGQFKETINDYIVPSAAYGNDVDLSEQVRAVVAEFVPDGSVLQQAEYGFVQIKATYNDGVVMRSLFHVTYCQTIDFDVLQPRQASSYEWLSLPKIEAIDYPSAVILRGLIAHVQHRGNRHDSPVISG